MMVQETWEAEADEFRPELKREEVEDVCEVLLIEKPSTWRSSTEDGYQGGSESRQLDYGRGAWDRRLQAQGVMRRMNRTMTTGNNLEATCTLTISNDSLFWYG